MKRFLPIVMSLFLNTFVKAESNHYYLKVLKNGVELGYYSNKWQRAKKIRRYAFHELNANEIRQTIFGEERGRVLYYFHCYLGNAPVYHHHSVKYLNQFSGIDKRVSIVWRSRRMGYQRSNAQAIREGKKLRELLSELFQTEANENVVLCHSMGNRVFEGVAAGLPADTRFKLILLAASDVDVHIFKDSWAQLPLQSQKIVVYQHRKDRLLKTSKIVLKEERLGLHALQHMSAFRQMPNVEVVDITDAAGQKLIDTSNHTYWKYHSGLQRDIQLLLLGIEDDSQRLLTENVEGVKLMQ
ncbi:MAG: alpha/beta hydrolase [Bacteroidota bacterium]